MHVPFNHIGLLQQIVSHSMQLAWMAFPFPYADLKFPFCTF
jgi:hypothetical protein